MRSILIFVTMICVLFVTAGCEDSNWWSDDSGDPGDSGACFFVVDLDHMQECLYRTEISLTCKTELSMIEYRWWTYGWTGDWKRFDMRGRSRAEFLQEFPFPSEYWVDLVAYDTQGVPVDQFGDRKDISCQ